MGLETVTKISDLNPLWPLAIDQRRYGDDHLRNIKKALLADTAGWFNVKAYGAVSDGTTDDKAAIQAAIDAAEAAGGGVVYFPTGRYRVSAGLVNDASNVILQGAGRGASVIVGDLAVTPVVRIGFSGTAPTYADAILVSHNSIQDLEVTRAAGTIPAGSIGVLWDQYFSGSQSNLLTTRHDIGEKLTHYPGVSQLSAYFHSLNFQAWDCLTAYLNVANATDVYFHGMQLGALGESFAVLYGVMFSEGAEQCNFKGITNIPRYAKPTPPYYPSYLYGWVGSTSLNGIFVFEDCNGGDNSADFMYSDATTAAIYGIRIMGGRWQGPGGEMFAFNAATAVEHMKVNGAFIGNKVTLALAAGSVVEIDHCTLYTGIAVAGTAGCVLQVKGNYVGNAASEFTGAFANLSLIGNSWYLKPTVTATGGFKQSGDSCISTGAALPDSPNPRVSITLPVTAGQNNDLDIGDATFVWLDGATGNFSISGFTDGVTGKVLYVLNPSASYTLTLKNNTGSAAGNKIYTPTGADIVIALTNGAVIFIYDEGVAGVGGWRVMASATGF